MPGTIQGTNRERFFHKNRHIKSSPGGSVITTMNRILHHFLSVIFVCFFGVFVVTDCALAVSHGWSISGSTTTCGLGASSEGNSRPYYCFGTSSAECPDDLSSHHIRYCRANTHPQSQTWAFECELGYTIQEVYRNGKWQYECRCGDDQYEVYANDANPAGTSHGPDDWNFTCKCCGEEADPPYVEKTNEENNTMKNEGPLLCKPNSSPQMGSGQLLQQCGWNKRGTYQGDYVCAAGFVTSKVDDDGYVVLQTGETVLNKKLECGCTGNNYIYVSRSNEISCKSCANSYTNNATCGGGNYICASNYIRSRQDGTLKNDSLSYPGYTAYYPSDSGYVCVGCNVCKKGVFKYMYTGTQDTTQQNHALYDEYCYLLSFVVSYDDAYYTENTCKITVPYTDATDNDPYEATGAACDATQIYDIPGMVMDADYSANKAIRDNNNILYALVRTTITKTAPLSYVDGTNGTANALCKKCADNSYAPDTTLQIGECPPLPRCATKNSDGDGVGFYCQAGCFKAFNGQTCYPCPYLGGDNWGNEIFWGISNNSVPGTTNGAYKESIAECTYNGDNIASKSDLSGSYSWGESCPVGNSVDPYYDRYEPPLGQAYYEVRIARSCQASLAECVFGESGRLKGAFPGYTSSEALHFFSVGGNETFSMDLSTAQALVRCALDNRSGCGSDSNFSVTRTIKVPNSTNSISTSINLNNF